MKKNSLENALTLLKQENYIITSNVCRGLVDRCSDCCLKEWEYSFCATPRDNHKNLYGIILARIRKKKLGKLLSVNSVSNIVQKD